MTYSIVARDLETGNLGVALQSHWFQAPSGAIWARPGVGAVATQALGEPSYGPLGLGLMESGATPQEALDQLLVRDDGRADRQISFVDASGRAAVHTGSSCIKEAGHIISDAFTVQANMMWRDTVWQAMATAFQASTGDFSGRLLAALDAAEAEGGDVRGRQSAGILIVRAEPTDEPWRDTLMDIEVADHPRPLEELRRLVDLKHAYDMLGDEPVDGDDPDRELRTSLDAMTMAPGSAEIAFWTMVELASRGRLEEARRAYSTCVRDGPGWAELLGRLARDNLAHITPQIAELILADENS